MNDAISRIINIILAAFLGLILIQDVYNKMDQYVYNQVNVVTNGFQKEVKTLGYIDKALYDRFLRELSKTGRLYDIKMLHRSINYYPNKNVSDGYSVEFFKHGEDEILEKTYLNGIYKMKIGDDFQVCVFQKGESKSQVLGGALMRGKLNNHIFATFGGVIENELE